MRAVLSEVEALLKAGKTAEAERALSAAHPDLTQAPAEVLAVAGAVQRALRRFAEARQLYVRAARLAPNNPRHRFELAEVLREEGQFGAAATTYEEVLRLDPSFPVARLRLARALLRSGRASVAEEQARQVLEKEPSAEAWDILAAALNAQERFEAALEASDAALRIEPSSRQARNTRAIVMGRMGKVEEALREFESLAARGAASSALTLNRAEALLDLGRSGEAEQLLEQGVAQWPENVALHTLLAKARWRRGAGEDFSAPFEAALERFPDVLALRLGCVNLLRRAGLEEKAEELLRQGLARAPDQPALLDTLGVLLDETDRTAEALPLLEQAVARAPMQQSGIFLTRALLRQGFSAEAMAQIAPMRVREPFDQTWISLETMALRQLGDARYHELCDYELMVAAYDLPAPAGYGDARAFNALLQGRLLALHTDASHPLDQTLRQGTQTTRNLQHVNDPVVQAYLAALAEPIRAYTERMRAKDHPWSGRKTGAFRLSGAWSVRLRPGGYHVNHIHPGGWISSAYYVALPQEMATQTGQDGWIKFGEPLLPTPGCSIEKVVRPEVGRLVLFPSYMWHGTIPFSAGERLTAPFDVVPA